ncbi:hypothetical protein A3A49_02060 [Candidatus Curtissbacteria bacterium RIFCSPLOWO2_01_FULL_38_11b]|uniref:Phosphoribosyltransferase domain-containing protein n=1 Tax=Candidatus Curtissbacteria bacterium RIFCSPLOWO2_01_FULL_38_11b TaxID=1797725 RepID=A0A1F5H1Q7_9BACT|nr:MAG: hypothetical protein A3A49_02060 [Candidatus Curtissbacteria bacterium RIFCSPLOWO2_01_FULL_38_11b]
MISLLDFIFPKKCVGCGKFGAYFCNGCYNKIEFVDTPVCPVCQRQAVGGKTHPGCAGRFRLDGLVVACRYQDPVKRAIAKVKYKWAYDIEMVFVDLLAQNLWRFDLPDEVVLVAVPLHSKRENWRGFNQSEILAESLSQKFKVPHLALLSRNRATQTQVGLKKEERKKNVRGAFAIGSSGQEERKPFDFAQAFGSEAQARRGKIMTDVRGQDIILVDDVFTSGATMAECAKVLKRTGAKSVWGMAVALG